MNRGGVYHNINRKYPIFLYAFRGQRYKVLQAKHLFPFSFKLNPDFKCTYSIAFKCIRIMLSTAINAQWILLHMKSYTKWKGKSIYQLLRLCDAIVLDLVEKQSTCVSSGEPHTDTREPERDAREDFQQHIL